MQAADALLLLGAGFTGGVVNAVAGGGSLLLFPAMVTTGLSTISANVTNSVALWPGYLGNLGGIGKAAYQAAVHHRDLTVISALCTTIGVAILLNTPTDAFDIVVPFLVIFAALLVAAQPLIRRRVDGHARHPIVLHIAVGIASIYGGYFGGGLGVILLGALGLTMPVPLRELNVLKAVLTMIVSTVSALCFMILADIDWIAVGVAAPAALAGGAVGGRIAMKVNERLLRATVVVFGIAVGVWLAIRAAH